MRLLAFLVIAASLVVGVIGAMTAYLPRIDEPGAPERLSGLRLNASAGKSSDAAAQPLVADETVLTPQAVEELRQAGVKRVRVREFSLGRWTGSWMFLVGCAGLLAAGFFLRATLNARSTASAFGTSGAIDPADALAKMRQEVEELLHRASGSPAPSAQLGYYGQGTAHLMVERIGELQKTQMPAFIEARTQLISRSGLAGYAQLMDAYAAAERAMNRAWSAAADNDEIEAMDSLRKAQALLEEAARRLPRQAT